MTFTRNQCKRVETIVNRKPKWILTNSARILIYGSIGENIDSAFIDDAEAVIDLLLVIPNYEINLEYTETQGNGY